MKIPSDFNDPKPHRFLDRDFQQQRGRLDFTLWDPDMVSPELLGSSQWFGLAEAALIFASLPTSEIGTVSVTLHDNHDRCYHGAKLVMPGTAGIIMDQPVFAIRRRKLAKRLTVQDRDAARDYSAGYHG